MPAAKIASIKIGPRKRPINSERVKALAESIKEIGLLNPVTVTDTGCLVGGYHRLEACQLLGWTEVDVRVVDLSELDTELAEIDENLIRNELTVLERADHLKRRKEIYLAKHPGTKQGGAPGLPGGGKAKTEMISSFADDTAAKTGLSDRTIRHEVQIASSIPEDVKEKIRGTDLADNKTELLRVARIKNPDEQKQVVERLVSGEASSVRRAKNLAVAEEIRREPRPMPDGKFRVIVIDPPWRYEKRAEDATHRSTCPYPDMGIDEICALSVGERAHDDCILWLWTTNAFLRQAYQCLDAWGFHEKTVLTWVKDRMGTGDWLRGKTEHCILAVRGKPTVVLTNQTTVIQAPMREHSRKPDEFYALVDELCPGSKLEIFARERRDGWVTWGAEEEKF
jgi:N6-adenosine-specific RNA methylase IME4